MLDRTSDDYNLLCNPTFKLLTYSQILDQTFDDCDLCNPKFGTVIKPATSGIGKNQFLTHLNSKKFVGPRSEDLYKEAREPIGKNQLLRIPQY